MTSRRSGGPHKGPRGLDDEDAALWSHVTQSYEPLRRVKQRVHTHQTDDPTGPRPAAPPPTVGNHHRPPTAHPHPPRPVPHAPPAAPHKVPPLADFDRRKAKKIAAGREAIDARIDLHGMRQSEAHLQLRAFLLSCYASGRQNVLVITGKGGPLNGGLARDDTEPSPFGFMDSRERGVLRRNVPHWLAEPELRAIVVSYRNAAQPHGGTGALYIHLRSRRKVGLHD